MIQSLATVLTVVTLVSVFTFIVIVRSQSFRVSPTWPLLAFFLPLLAAILDLRIGILPVFSDAQFYDQLAWDTALAWQQGNFLPNSFRNLRTQAYASIVAVIYFFSGHVSIAAITLNSAIWGLTVCYWLRLNREVFGVRSEAFGILLTLYPAGLMYAASFLRETIVMFFLVVSLLHLSRWYRCKQTRNLLVGGVAVSLLMIFRPEILPLVIVSGCFAIAFDLSRQLSRIKRYGVVSVTGVVTVAVFLILNVPGYYNPFRLDFLETKRRNLAQYSFSYLETLAYESWLDVLLYLPIRVFYFLFQPFPWNPANYNLTFATIDALFLVVITPLAILGVIRFRSKLSTEHIFLLAFAGLSIIGYALVVSTKGAVTRRRLLAMPILLLLANLVLPRIRIVRQSVLKKHKNN
jgi:hypothetical protein